MPLMTPPNVELPFVIVSVLDPSVVAPDPARLVMLAPFVVSPMLNVPLLVTTLDAPMLPLPESASVEPLPTVVLPVKVLAP